MYCRYRSTTRKRCCTADTTAPLQEKILYCRYRNTTTGKYIVLQIPQHHHWKIYRTVQTPQRHHRKRYCTADTAAPLQEKILYCRYRSTTTGKDIVLQIPQHHHRKRYCTADTAAQRHSIQEMHVTPHPMHMCGTVRYLP